MLVFSFFSGGGGGVQAQPAPSRQQHVAPGAGMAYGSQGGSAYRTSPSHSVSNSMASSYRREDSRTIPQQPSEDGMGSVLGTIAGTEDPANEDLQWKRSALKKFHKVKAWKGVMEGVGVLAASTTHAMTSRSVDLPRIPAIMLGRRHVAGHRRRPHAAFL